MTVPSISLHVIMALKGVSINSSCKNTSHVTILLCGYLGLGGIRIAAKQYHNMGARIEGGDRDKL